MLIRIVFKYLPADFPLIFFNTCNTIDRIGFFYILREVYETELFRKQLVVE